jgi:hypothetical protein
MRTLKNKIYLSILLTILFVNFVNTQVIVIQPNLKKPCPNGNAESNNFTNWGTYTGSAVGNQTFANFVANFDANKFYIVNSNSSLPITPSGQNIIPANPIVNNGKDFYGNFNVPNEGQYCFVLGNNAAPPTHAEVMRYTFLVTNENKNFKFRYALVLYDPDAGHLINERPVFSSYLTLGNSITPSTPADFALYNSTFINVIADRTNPFFKTSNVDPRQPNVVYKDWQCQSYDLSAYVGQTVSFCARVRGCTVGGGGHFGYAYIDGLCQEMPAVASFTIPKTQFCLEEPIVINAAGCSGEDRYFVSVLDNMTGIEVSDWFLAAQAPSAFDIKQFYLSKGKQFECGKTYRIKVAVVNNCSPWNETSKTISIVCPKVTSGLSKTVCCGQQISTGPITLGEPAQVGYNYSWTSAPSTVITPSNSSIITVPNPTQSISYTVTKTETTTGCTVKSTVIFRIIPNYTISIEKLPYLQCDNTTRLKAILTGVGCAENPLFISQNQIDNTVQVKWYWKPNGSSTRTFLGIGSSWAAPNTVDGIIYAEYQNCQGLLVSANMTIIANPENHDRTLYAPNSFTPNGNNPIFRIIAGGLTAPINIGDGPAYDAIDFRLRLWNRWGENFLTIDKAYIGRVGPLMQGDIQWDGTFNGSPVQDGVYNYTLEMQYCRDDFFTPVNLDGCSLNQCVNWAWLICLDRVPGCSKFVNLIR